MTANWTAFPYKRALATKVAALEDVTSLTPKPRVLTYFPSPDEPLTDSIIIGHTSSDGGTRRAHAGGPRFDEQVDVECQIRVVRPGAGQEAADQAEDRAEALLALLDAVIRNKDTAPKVGDQSWAGKLANRSSDLFAYLAGEGSPVMVCLIDFTIQYNARTS